MTKEKWDWTKLITWMDIIPFILGWIAQTIVFFLVTFLWLFGGFFIEKDFVKWMELFRFMQNYHDWNNSDIEKYD